MQTLAEIRAALDAFERDGKVECRLSDSTDWKITTAPLWCFTNHDFRPVPKPILGPWESLAEVPLSDWFYRDKVGMVCRVTRIETAKVYIEGFGWVDLAALFNGWKHASDPINGPWLPCGKEVVK